MADVLVDDVLPDLSPGSWIIDMGTGSGALASLGAAYSKSYRKNFRFIAAESESAALKTAWDNLIFQYGLQDYATVIQSNLFEGFEDSRGDPVLEQFLQEGHQAQVILFNPPIMPASAEQLKGTLSARDKANFDYVIREGEEHSDGLGVVREFLGPAKRYLHPERVVISFLPEFLGREKIEEAFREAGFSPHLLKDEIG